MVDCTGAVIFDGRLQRFALTSPSRGETRNASCYESIGLSEKENLPHALVCGAPDIGAPPGRTCCPVTSMDLCEEAPCLADGILNVVVGARAAELIQYRTTFDAPLVFLGFGSAEWRWRR